MDFGITIKPDLHIDRIVSLTHQAEAGGFSYGWIFDSHVIWMEPFPLMTLMAANTQTMRLGTCVTNPAVRDVTVSASLFATLNLTSNGRMQLGIGRGDSSRRVLGKKPTTLENLEQFVNVFRELNAGNTVDHEGVSTSFPWTNGEVPPVWVAGYGPKALRTAGRIGDGVILQFADPDLIAWCLGFVREGAKEAGPRLQQDRSHGRCARLGFERFENGARAGELVPRARFEPRDGPDLEIQARGVAPVAHVVRQKKRRYDYHHHCEVGSDNADFVSDEVIDRFCLVGPVEDHRKKLEALNKVGVTQFNIYLMCGDEEKTLDVYSRESCLFTAVNLPH